MSVPTSRCQLPKSLHSMPVLTTRPPPYPTQDPPARERDKFAVFAQLEHYSVYGCSDARRDFKAPCDEAVILRTGHQLRCLACDDSATRRCWQTALRVAKVR